MFCQNCGEKIDDGVKFCEKCGKAINSMPASQAPAQNFNQAVQSSENNQITKQGPLSYNAGLIKTLKGTAVLFNNRLEWKGEKGATVVINISEINKTEVSTIKQTFTIHLVNSQKHVFSKTLTSGDVAKQLAFGYLGSGNIITELEGWRTAVEIVRGRS